MILFFVITIILFLDLMVYRRNCYAIFDLLLIMILYFVIRWCTIRKNCYAIFDLLLIMILFFVIRWCMIRKNCYYAIIFIINYDIILCNNNYTFFRSGGVQSEGIVTRYL